jgi:hypothetical protein
MGDRVSAAAINKSNLTRLAERPSGDVKARLLIALTALYVERPAHSDEEKRQYAELAQRLIDVVDDTTRTIVAGILKDHELAPLEMSERTSRAAPSVCAGPPAPHIAYPPADATAEPAARSDDVPVPVTWGEAFFRAAGDERRNMLARIARCCEGRNLPPMKDIAKADCERLDAAALQGWVGEFMRDLERVLDLPRSLCERIVNDPCGEPIVVAATAVQLPIAVLQRVLLLVNPAVGHSVERVFDLTNLFYELDRRAAASLMSLWRDAARRKETTPSSPALPPAAERSRPAVGLQARFGALSARVRDHGIASRADRGGDVRSHLRSG